MRKRNSVLEVFSAARREGGASLLLTALAIAIALLPPDIIAKFQFDRAAILSDDVYRLFICHWTHWNLNHLVWDTLTFLCLGIACERRNRPQMICAVLFPTLAVPVILLFFKPDMSSYRGLSAIDSALFALLSLTLLREQLSRRKWPAVLAIGFFIGGFLAKTLIEYTQGAAVFVNNTAAHFVPVPLAHLVGAAAGASLSLFPAERSCARSRAVHG
jgi:rhomboid family GlyGly-CTERM serine protease